MRQNKTEYDWLSCYIYYGSNPDRFLTDKMYPLVQDSMQKKKAKQFFFIRYHDRLGPHIRLRFKGKKEILEESLKPLLQKKFPNSRFVMYRPEIGRYGGKNGILISEKEFEASSKVILSYLDAIDEPSYENSLGFALQLNISTARLLGMKRSEAAAFFGHTAKQGDIQEFKKLFSNQKYVLFPTLINSWNACSQKKTLDIPWFEEWRNEISAIGEELRMAYNNGKIYADPHKTHRQNPLWFIYESYIHMNNNRLGIFNGDEPYIDYILEQTLLYGK